jgi:FixJ family two-component response regulator
LNRSDLADSLVSAVRQLHRAKGQDDGSAHSVQLTPLSTRRWRMVDRLGAADTERLVAAFAAGTSKRELAERYGISESSVKRLIRQHGASKMSSDLAQRRKCCLPLVSRHPR